MPPKLNLTGKVFGRIKVLSEHPERNKRSEVLWNCECDCGTRKRIPGRDLKRGHVKSCGCLQRETATTHGLSKDPLCAVWRSMVARCNISQNISYKNYGARGISVCEEWCLDVSKFIKWARSNGYESGLQIDRINNDGNYHPENCRFITRQLNTNNTRGNYIIEVDGDSMSLAAACRKYNAKYEVVTQRINKLGWGAEKALTTPVRKFARSA